MQYWQRRLQRSVTESRRLRSGRPKRSDESSSSQLSLESLLSSGAPARPRRRPAMSRRHWISVLATTAVLTAAPLAQNQPSRSPGCEPRRGSQDDARTQKLKAEAVADVDGMQTFTQQMVDSDLQLRRAGLPGDRDQPLPDRHPRRRTASPCRKGIAGIPTAFVATLGIGQAGASRSARTSTASRRRRRSRASRITIRSSRARPATAKGTTPARR